LDDSSRSSIHPATKFRPGRVDFEDSTADEAGRAVGRGFPYMGSGVSPVVNRTS
jgi:hypothetical protein